MLLLKWKIWLFPKSSTPFGQLSQGFNQSFVNQIDNSGFSFGAIVNQNIYWVRIVRKYECTPWLAEITISHRLSDWTF